MKKESLEFLKNLVNSPSPSGYEEPARKIWKSYLEKHVDDLKTDLHGNSIAVINPDAKLRVMLSGHIDEIGFMVTHIEDSGLVKFAAIGGVPESVVPGKRVHIHTKKGKVFGVIGQKAIHVMEPDERTKVQKIKNLWIDLGLSKKEEVEKIIELGDPVTFIDEFEMLSKDVICARGFDDRIGAWVVAEVMKKLSKKKPKIGVYGVASVQEEIGLRGATTSTYGVNPDVGIAIDVTFATDTPDMGAVKPIMGNITLGGGPAILRGPNANPKVYEMLVNAGKENKIDYQIEVYARGTGTDANAIQLSRGGVAAGLVSIPNRYMHTPVELVSLKDIENTVNLLVEFILDIEEDTSFIPED